MDKEKIVVMAGTTEGRLLAERLEKCKKAAHILVATDYGEKVLPEFAYCKVHTGRFDAGQLEDFYKEQGITLVYDATHPYAKEVTRNCKAACEKLGIIYQRILRKQIMAEDYLPENQFERFDNLEQIGKYLEMQKGNIFAATGSKEVDKYCNIPEYQKRVILRVLPNIEIKQELMEKGFAEENIIMGQGPFSVEDNEEIIKRYNIKYMVTKESGIVGGFVEKLEAANNQGVFVALVKRPEEEGILLEQVTI